MTTKCIVLHRPDGGITIRHPAPDARLDGETEADFLERVRTSSRRQADATAFQVVEFSSIPTDFTFRDAWKCTDGRFDVRMDKAKDIWRERLRRDREPLLAALDVEWSRAMAKGDAIAAQEIEARRQALRDIPADPAIDAAQTPAELKAIRAQDRLSK